MKQAQFDGWLSVFDSGTDYECEMVKNRLLDAGIHAVIMTKKDSAFNLSNGSMSRIYVLVSPEMEGSAQSLLSTDAFSTEELTAAALASNPEQVEAPDREPNGSGSAK